MLICASGLLINMFSTFLEERRAASFLFTGGGTTNSQGEMVTSTKTILISGALARNC